MSVPGESERGKEWESEGVSECRVSVPGSQLLSDIQTFFLGHPVGLLLSSVLRLPVPGNRSANLF